MRKRVRIALWILVIAGLGASACLGWQWLDAKAKYRQLRVSMGEIQRAVERYAVDHDGCYPASVTQVVDDGLLPRLPDNPYAPGPMPILAPADQPQTGGVVYIPIGPIITISADADLARAIVPTELDQYYLIAYGPRLTHRKCPDYLTQVEAEFSTVKESNGKRSVLVQGYADLKAVTWNRAVLVLTAGEDWGAS